MNPSQSTHLPHFLPQITLKVVLHVIQLPTLPSTCHCTHLRNQNTKVISKLR